MKTKEIVVWVRPDEIDSNGISCQTNRHDKWQIEAKLIIEIPEKKIEITESEFNDISAEVIANYPNNHTATSAVTRAYREAFFNKD